VGEAGVVSNIVDIPIELIDPSPYQHRRSFSPAKLKELASSITRDGLIQPVVLRVPNGNGRYELIAGERRWRAMQLAELPTILARLVDVSDIQARRMCAAENLQREDLSAIEEINAIVEMVDAELIEDGDYRRLGETPVERVKWLLGRMESCRVNDVSYDNFIRKIAYKVNITFSRLPKPIRWDSFYRHDLPLVTSIDDDVAEFAAENKLNKSQTRETQRLKKQAPEIFEKAKGRRDEDGRAIITTGIFSPEDVPFSDLSAREINRLPFQRSVVRSETRSEVIHISDDSYEWYTPPKYISAARKVMGDIDLDPATSEEAQEAVRATRYYTQRVDGLRQSWRGRVWLNPPYNMPLVEQFTNKAIESYKSGDVTEAIILVNNATDTKWFQSLLDYPICLVRGRVQFFNPYGLTLQTRQGQAIFYLGNNIGRFAEVFSKFGPVLCKYDDQQS